MLCGAALRPLLSPFGLDFSTAGPYDRGMTGKDRRYLRGLAHPLSAVVIVGQQGLSDGVVRQIDTALTDHELIKVRLSSECPVDRAEAATVLAERTGAELAGTIGHVLILYRPHPERPRIVLPGQGAAAPG